MLDDRVVDRWLDRGNRFFRATTRNKAIRTALLARGLNKSELQGGWRLYSAVLGVNESDPMGDDPITVNEAEAAMSELDAWDSPNFSAAQAVLETRAPTAMRFLFSQLSASEGPAAVVAVETFLNRRDQLKAGDAPGVDSEQAKLAVELLAQRRIVDDRRATELRALIDKAQSGATPAPSAPPPRLDEHTFERYRGWLNEWREVARSTFTRRDHLIALGLASRRAGRNGETAEEVEENAGSDGQ